LTGFNKGICVKTGNKWKDRQGVAKMRDFEPAKQTGGEDEGPPIIVPRSEPDPGCVSAEFRDLAEVDDSGEADQSPEARKKRAFEDFFREERKRKPYPSQRGWGRYW
jgi:hypothetical protein